MRGARRLVTTSQPTPEFFGVQRIASALLAPRPRISLLVPCHNEEKTLHRSVSSWLHQTRPADEIIIVDDSSTDATSAILAEYSWALRVVRTAQCTGGKSHAQEFGFRYITGDIVVTTDGDTLLDERFLERIEEDFQDPAVVAVGGYVRSIPYNWLTACRAIDYAVGQNVDKVAQDYLGFMFVIPGAAGAFRVSTFRSLIHFDHDTLAEDLDFTYKLHYLGLGIMYDRKAICYTVDPPDLRSYVNQMRRWYGGGWQNLMKHIGLPQRPGMALELSLMYIDGLVSSCLLFFIPLLNLPFALGFFTIYFWIIIALGSYAALKEKRIDVLGVLPWYIMLRYVHAWIYLEQFLKEVVLRQRGMVWFQAARIRL